MTYFRSFLLLALFLLAGSVEAYTYPSPLTSANATSATGQRCTGAVVSAIGSASGIGSAPATDSIAWGLLGANYSGGLPANYNNGSYCIQAALTTTTEPPEDDGCGPGVQCVFERAINILALFAERAIAQTSSWSIEYTVHSTAGKAALNTYYALTYSGPVSSPTATLNASPTTIAGGGSSQLTWSSTNATSCTGTNFNTGGATSGSVSVSPPTTTTYTVTCTGANGSASANRQVTVTSPPSAPTANLTVSPTNPASGQSVTLTWSSTNATSCTSSQFDTEGYTSGSKVVTPSGTTTYTITCYGSTGTGSGTWQYEHSDLTDLACPWTDPNRPYTGTPNCTFTQTGDPCTNPPDRLCKKNSGGAGQYSCIVQTEVYVCQTSGVTPSVSDDAVVTTTGVSAALSADRLSVASGEAVNLTWSSTGAQRCAAQESPLDESKPEADLFQNESEATGGSDTVRPTEDTTYSIYCYGPGFTGGGGSGDWAFDSVDIDVAEPECSDGADNDGAGGADYPTDPSCTSADDDTEDGNTGLACSPNPSTSSSVPAQVVYTASGGSGSYTWTPSAPSTTCTTGNPVTCTLTVPGTHAMSVNGGGSASCSPDVTAACAGPVELILRANNSTQSARVNPGDTVTLDWQISGVYAPTTCSLTSVGDVTPQGACEVSDSQSVGPINTQTVFTLACGADSTSIIVNVSSGLREF